MFWDSLGNRVLTWKGAWKGFASIHLPVPGAVVRGKPFTSALLWQEGLLLEGKGTESPGVGKSSTTSPKRATAEQGMVSGKLLTLKFVVWSAFTGQTWCTAARPGRPTALLHGARRRACSPALTSFDKRDKSAIGFLRRNEWKHVQSFFFFFPPSLHLYSFFYVCVFCALCVLFCADSAGSLCSPMHWDSAFDVSPWMPSRFKWEHSDFLPSSTVFRSSAFLWQSSQVGIIRVLSWHMFFLEQYQV